ncbi:MAG: hypothetical protein M3M98_03225, partial [Nitrospirota bacterium]|nr:hypothetical protein [Nitrospirota bacterium]
GASDQKPRAMARYEQRKTEEREPAENLPHAAGENESSGPPKVLKEFYRRQLGYYADQLR